MRYFKPILTLVCFLCIAVKTNAQDIYADPDGLSTNTGEIDSPWDLQTGLDNIMPGQTLYLRDGVYHGRFNTYNTDDGSLSEEPKIITSYPGEWAILDGNVNGMGNAFGNGSTLTVTKPYMWFKGFELTFLGDYSRTTEYNEGGGCIKNCSGAINHHSGIKCKFINLIIREHPGNGIWTTKASGGLEIYGCLIYNNGNEDPTQALGTPDDGSGIYAQNSTDFWDNYNNNLFFNNFKVGAKMYSDSRNGGGSGPPDYIKNLNFEDNTILNSGSPLNPTRGRECFIVGSNSRIQGRAIPHHINVKRNFMYHNRGSIGIHAEALRIGQQLVGGSGPLNGPNFYGNYAHDVNIEDNYIIGRAEGLRLIRVGENFNFKRNIVGSGYVFSRKNLDFMNSDDWHFEDNTYFTKYQTYFGQQCENSVDDCRFNCPRTILFYFDSPGFSGKRTLEEMREIDPGCYQIESNDPLHLSVDMAYNYTNLNNFLHSSGNVPNNNSNVLSITQNEYQPNRFKIVVYEKDAGHVKVNLVHYNIPVGTPYSIRDAENYFTVVDDPANPSNIFITNTIVVPMDLPDIDLPDGEYPSKAANVVAKKSNPEVGVFIVEFDDDFCIPDLTFQNETQSGNETHEAGNSITTAGSSTYFDVTSGADIIHKAGNYVLLKEGSHIKNGSKYLATIEDCTSGNNGIVYVGESHPNDRKSISKTKKEHKKHNEIKVSPNPTSGAVNISTLKVMTNLKLSNVFGKIYIDVALNNDTSKKTHLDLGNFPTGIYFLQITLKTGEIITKQIVKK